MEGRIQATADAIVSDLFATGFGDVGDRLVIRDTGRLLNLGGWSREAVRERLLVTLRAFVTELHNSATLRVLLDIARERERQRTVEGWTPEHDDEHTRGELAAAAACYSMPPGLGTLVARQGSRNLEPAWVPLHWPFDASSWKPKTRRENVIRAGALIVAEAERLDRAEGKPCAT